MGVGEKERENKCDSDKALSKFKERNKHNHKPQLRPLYFQDGRTDNTA